jgi:hypothetical protein
MKKASKKPTVGMPLGEIRDRIKEFRRVPAEQLKPSPDNFRLHPDGQRGALRAILKEVGYAGAALARELPDGSLELIDGHLRTEEGKGQMIPTLVLDVTESEARKLVALYDPLGDLAAIDSQHVQQVVNEIEVQEAELKVMLLELTGHGREKLGDELGPKGDKDGDIGPVDMLLRPYEHYDYVMVLARNTMDWQALCSLLDLEMVDSSPVPAVRKIGVGRCIDAGKLLGMLRAQAK